jgi:hypothetical protein
LSDDSVSARTELMWPLKSVLALSTCRQFFLLLFSLLPPELSCWLPVDCAGARTLPARTDEVAAFCRGGIQGHGQSRSRLWHHQLTDICCGAVNKWRLRSTPCRFGIVALLWAADDAHEQGCTHTERSRNRRRRLGSRSACVRSFAVQCRLRCAVTVYTVQTL